MKKVLSIILALVVLCTLFAACGNDDFPKPPEPRPTDSSQEDGQDDLPVLRILIDLELEGNSTACREIESFLRSHAEGCGTDYQVEVETLPGVFHPDERNPVLMGKHMELLKDAPDVYIMRNYSDPMKLLTDLKNFFPYPASAMRQRFFLPLDDYIAADPDWENLRPQVMEAGKLDGSQQLVPLSFWVSAWPLDPAVYTPPENLPMTWDEMLDSDDGVQKWVAAYADADVFGVLADYANEELNFTEEELLDVVNRMRAARQETAGWNLQEAGIIGPSMAVIPAHDSTFNADPEVNYCMVPTCNREGGVTAHVSTFAAVSRGTEYPDYAWNIMKALFSEDGQRNSLLTVFELPVRMGMCQESAPAAGGWYLDDWDYQQLVNLQEQINAVEFVTSLTDEMTALFEECGGLEDSEVEAAVHKHYTTMKMMLAES